MEKGNKIKNTKKWHIGLFRKNPFGQIEHLILHYYQHRDGQDYLNAWRYDGMCYWYRSYKDIKRASAVAQTILCNCNSVLAAYVFDDEHKFFPGWYSDEKGNIMGLSENYFAKYIQDNFKMRFKVGDK